MHPSAWKDLTEKNGCPMGPGWIQILEFLCTTTTCSPHSYGVSGLRRHPRGLLRAIYARFWMSISEKHPSTHSGAKG